MFCSDEGACVACVLGLLSLLGDGLRLLLPVLFFREPQPALRHIDQDRSLCFKRDGARKV
jgi:hypothetical protein